MAPIMGHQKNGKQIGRVAISDLGLPNLNHLASSRIDDASPNDISSRSAIRHARDVSKEMFRRLDECRQIRRSQSEAEHCRAHQLQSVPLTMINQLPEGNVLCLSNIFRKNRTQMRRSATSTCEAKHGASDRMWTELLATNALQYDELALDERGEM
jgi:hypothetical protein